MATKVIGVILTYNRKELLELCLKAIHSQTRPCDMILVINNASTDGTLEFLTSGKYPNIHVYTLRKNVGAAGGFNVGFRLAYDNGADHVWMMDDDVIPEPDALEKLLEADELLERKGLKRSYLLSTAYTELGQVTNTPQVSNVRNNAGYCGWPEQLEHGLVAVDSGTFVSILVPRETLKAYGLPISAMFIWGEDAEFTLRVTRDTPGYLVGTSRVAHLRHGGGTISIVKESNPIRISYYKNYIRNNLYIAKKYKSKRRAMSIVFNNIYLAMKLIADRQPNKAWVVIIGVLKIIKFKPRIEYVEGEYDYANIILTCPNAKQVELREGKRRDILEGTEKLGYLRHT